MKDPWIKLLVSFLAAISIFCWALPSQAATVTELQATINALIAQVTALQAQLAILQSSTSSSLPLNCAGITFNRPLLQGSYGNDVKCLQTLLNRNTDTRIANSGPGSLGQETYYFGYLTKLAVIRLQNKYASEILTPSRLTYGTGIVGPSTRTKLNTICSSFTTTVPPVTTPTTTIPVTPTTTIQDLISPAAISSPYVSNITNNSIALSWTAPGDDGTIGTAYQYDIRYSTSLINDSNWNSAAQVSGEPTPFNAGTSQSFILSGLSASTTYYFAIKSSDEANNISPLSNIVSGKTMSSQATDTTEPVRSGSSPSGTLTSGTTQTTISLSTNESATCKYSTTAGTAYSSMTGTFTTTGGTTHSKAITGLTNGSSYTYYVRCTDSSSNVNTSDHAISFAVSSPSCVDCGLGTPNIAPASPISNTSFTITCPANNTGYDCINAYANGSSNQCTFSSYSGNNALFNCTGLTTGTYTSKCEAVTGTSRNCCANVKTGSYTVQAAPDTTAPSQITNLSVSTTTQSSVTIQWTSPGDDGTTGTAISYDIRYATTSITSSSWVSDAQASGEPTPLIRGTNQSFIVTGLKAGTTYYFAIKSIDDANNTSILSNVVSGKTSVASTGECYGALECNPTGEPIGGNATYSHIYTSGDYTVTSYAQLVAALASKPGVIYVPASANIDMTGHFSLQIPAGFTLASNRGSGGSLGGRIYQTKVAGDPTNNPVMFWVEDNVRITGLRIEGPDTSSASLASGTQRVAIGSYNHQGLEIDNNEIYGWSDAAIYVGQSGRSDLVNQSLSTAEIGSSIANIHHNYIHHCQTSELGYGILDDSIGILIKANIFDYTRHAITSNGKPGSAYEASYNVHQGNTTNNVFDVHVYPVVTPEPPTAIAGDTFRIHHNTFNSSQPAENHVESYDVGIQGNPVTGANIYKNRMQFYTWALRPPVVHGNGVLRVSMSDNLIGAAQTYYADGPIEYTTLSPVTDTTAPSQITNLSVSTITQTSVTLSWTSPGDDGTVGTATSYDIRYSTASITSSNWTPATAASGEPAPSISGTSQTFTVTGLTANTTYYFAIKAIDDAGNISALSNVISGKTLAVVDTTPPIADFVGFPLVGPAPLMTDFTNLSTGAKPMTYAWSFNNNGYIGSTEEHPPINEGYSALGYHSVSLTATNAYGSDTEVKLNYINVLPASTTDTTAPSQITSLSASSPAQSSITLSWTAPGDDGTTGKATSYDIRYSTASITSSNWTSATAVSEEPTPLTSGISQTFTVTGLTANTTYYFAIKAIDDTNNSSVLSNIASGKTLAAPSGFILYLSDYGIKGDGSDETAKFQSALNYAKSNGYTAVSFPTGGKTIGISESMTLPGDMEYIGNGCTLYLLDDSYIIEPSYYTFNYYAGNNVYIHNLIFDGNMTKQYRPSSCNGKPLSSYYFPKCPNGGIIGYDNFRFEYNEVKNYGGYMVEVNHGDNAIISHNTLHDGWQYAICTAGTDSNYSNNALIEYNTIYRMGQVGIKMQHTSNSTIRNNTITMPARYDLFSVPSVGSSEPTGIRLYSYDGPNNHVTITGNAITGSGGNSEIAIQSDDSANTYISITNNQITNANTGININFNNGTITGNSITYKSVCIGNSGSGNTVTNNTCNVSSPSCIDCGLGTPVIAPASPISSQSFTITCPANASGYDCINAYSNGSSNKCTYSSWSGNNVIFNCTGLTTGSYTSKCEAITGTSRNCCANVKTGSYTVQAAADTTAPSQITNLSLSNIAQNSVTLSWTAPGDDGTTGKATSYDIRYSTGSITSSNWTSATAVSGEPTPSTSGTSQTFTVTGLTVNTTYYFAIRATDDAGNVSTVSNVPSGKTLTATTGECYGAEACNPTGSPIGGGAGYLKTVTSGNYTVTTASQLVSAAASAISGQTIFIPSTASIDLTGYSTIVVNPGVTLASDRGYSGHSGALIFRTDLTPGGWQNGMITAKSNSRITGIRIRGFQSVYNGDYGDWALLTTGIGVTDQTGVEIDNNEIYYFSYNGVMLRQTSYSSNSNTVHHNYIHNIAGRGEGYGVGVCRGTALIEANHFDYVRHAVSGVGYAGESYEARFNVHGSYNIDTNYDVHAADQAGSEWDGSTPSGRLYKIHHNTVPSAVDGYESLYYVSPPTEGMYVYNNRLGNRITAHGGTARLYMTNNYVGGVFYSAGQ